MEMEVAMACSNRGKLHGITLNRLMVSMIILLRGIGSRILIGLGPGVKIETKVLGTRIMLLKKIKAGVITIIISKIKVIIDQISLEIQTKIDNQEINITKLQMFLNLTETTIIDQIVEIESVILKTIENLETK